MAHDYPTYFAHHARQGQFRRRLLGLHPGDVREHLDAVAGWFSLTGLDEVVDAHVRDAEREAAQIIEDARAEARAIIEAARRQAALERRGRSRVGRPVGAGSNGG
jgi:cell division septum initiation protein DivIVA